MATNTDWEDDDFEIEDEPQDNNNLVKQLRKQLRQQQKEKQELAEKFESLSKTQREAVIKQVLDQKGVNQKAARLIMKDLEDVNEETVSNWLDDNGDLFGLTRQQEESPQQQADLAALRQQDIVTQGALTPDRAQDAVQRINDAASAEEIIAMIHSGNF